MNVASRGSRLTDWLGCVSQDACCVACGLKMATFSDPQRWPAYLTHRQTGFLSQAESKASNYRNVLPIPAAYPAFLNRALFSAFCLPFRPP